jgi:cytochrome b561
MKIRNSDDRYGLVSLTLHWLTAILVVVAWLLGQGGDLLPNGAPRAAGLFVHMSTGLGVFVLVILRLIWRVIDPPLPQEATRLGRLIDTAAHVGHWILIALLIVVPITGILLQFARGNAVPVFGFWEIASPWMADRAFARTMRQPHEVLSNALMLLAGVHAAAALFHHWVLRDRTLQRMLPHAS